MSDGGAVPANFRESWASMQRRLAMLERGQSMRARQSQVDGIVSTQAKLILDVAPLGNATALPTPNTLSKRDANGRTQFVSPAATNDAATKGYVDSMTWSASDITSGTLSTARIPDLDASKITSGTFSTARIPSMDASKITSGTIQDDRLPARLQDYRSTDVSDFNSTAMYASGWYFMPSAANSPTGSSWYSCQVIAHDTTSYRVQIAHDYWSDRVFHRRQEGGTWRAWKEITLGELDSSWTNFSTINSFTQASGREAGYRRIGDVVHLRGEVYRSSAPSGNVQFATLPSGFRPTRSVFAYTVPFNAASQPTTVEVSDTGACYIMAPNTRTTAPGYSISGVCFPVN